MEERRICVPRASYHLFAPLADGRAAAVNYRNWQIRHSSTPSVINAGRGNCNDKRVLKRLFNNYNHFVSLNMFSIIYYCFYNDAIFRFIAQCTFCVRNTFFAVISVSRDLQPFTNTHTNCGVCYSVIK